MSRDPSELISRALDGLLTDAEQHELTQWISQSPDHARQYALAVLLHDRIANELRGQSLWKEIASAPQPAISVPRRRSWMRWFAVSLSLVVLGGLLWKGVLGTPASAAVELNRLISANLVESDRTFRISVEAVEAEPGRRARPPEPGRPPKPPMQGAVLHVRAGGQFVLIRRTEDGQTFVTGSNGLTSWAVRSDGPVRVSRDLNRFNRDVPGHEYAMPLDDLQACLQSLRDAYEVRFPDSVTAGDFKQLLAIRGRKLPGPSRVEITYEPASGLIHELRFVGMPYGPEKLTLGMTVETASDLGADYFTHSAHHSPDREVIEE